MTNTTALTPLPELRIPGVHPNDVQAFAREHDVLHADRFTRPIALCCPSCVALQFDESAAAGTCEVGHHCPEPGLAAATREAYAIVAAYSRFNTKPAAVARERHGATIDAAFAMYYRSPQPWDFAHRYMVWAYTPRGQQLIDQAYRDLQSVTVAK